MLLFDRRRTLVLALAPSAAWIASARAQAFPSRPITLISGFGPGSPQDLIVRATAEAASAELRQPIIIESKTGAAGAVSASAISTQKADGYTVGAVISAALTVAPVMQKVVYDPATSFTYLNQIGRFPLGIAVKADSGFTTWADVVAQARARPGVITYATPGPASIVNLGMQKLQALAEIKLTHVPYQGNATIAPAVLGGHVDLMVTGSEWKPFVEAGQMRVLMMWTEERLPAFASTPTVRELGYPFDLDVSFGLIAPRSLDPAIADRLRSAFGRALSLPSVRTLMAKFDVVPSDASGDAYQALMVQSAAELTPIVRDLGLARKE